MKRATKAAFRSLVPLLHRAFQPSFPVATTLSPACPPLTLLCQRSVSFSQPVLAGVNYHHPIPVGVGVHSQDVRARSTPATTTPRIQLNMVRAGRPFARAHRITVPSHL